MAGKKVLVADDEAHIVNVVAMKLRKAGFEVVTASDGAEALALAQADPPDLVITDCQMPELDGLALSRALKDSPATAEVPVIMLTGRGFEISGSDTEATNVREVLPKPFSPRQILDLAGVLLATDAIGS